MASLGIIFDADGVLFDSERQSREALRLALENITLGRVCLDDLPLEFFCGRDDDSLIDEVNRQYALNVDKPRFAALKLDCYRRTVEADPVVAAPGALELLDQLDASDVPCAVATSAVRAKLDVTLSALGLQDRFQTIASADDVAAGKPDPAIFLTTATRMRLPPDRLIVFEDTVNGILAANRAGMYSVGVVGTFQRHQLANACQVVETLAHISVPLLESWINDRHPNTHGESPQ